MVVLVSKVFEAKPNSLIVLDEPEVSLHPGAQERLVEFLLERIKVDKHQVVVGTHSPFIIKNLPSTAIKTLYLDPSSNNIKSTKKTIPEEAFFHLGIRNIQKKTILVEDRLTKAIATKAIRGLGQAIHEQISIKYLPGGSDALLREYLPSFALTDRADVLFLLDGDQSPKYKAAQERDLSSFSDEELETIEKTTFGGLLKISVDGGKLGSNSDQHKQARIKILEFSRKFLTYLPGDHQPELFIWENMSQDITKYSANFDEIGDYKARFEKLCRLELDKGDYEVVSSDDIFHTQQHCLKI